MFMVSYNENFTVNFKYPVNYNSQSLQFKAHIKDKIEEIAWNEV